MVKLLTVGSARQGSSASTNRRMRKVSSWSCLGLLVLCLMEEVAEVASAVPRRIPATLSASGLPTNSVAQVAGSAAALSTQSAARWLEEHTSPERFTTRPSANYVLKNSEYALKAREKIPAAASVPEALFLREVLPYQQLDEPLDEWRQMFFEKLSPFAMEAKTLREVVDKVAPRAFTDLGHKVEFKPNCTPAIMAPVTETLKNGHASCTGCSIFLVDALRAVGVPARVVGTAEWNLPTGGNHNWVEVWTGEGEGDGWQFFDAAPMNKVEWDRAWFVPNNVREAIAGGKHGIYAPVWDKADANANYTITWREPFKMMAAVDRTSFYQNLQASCPDCPYTGLPQ